MAKAAAKAPAAPANPPRPADRGLGASQRVDVFDTRAASLAGLALVLLATCAIYYYSQALSGGILWDDDAHITKPDLRSWEGLGLIWWPIARLNPAYNEEAAALGVPKWLPGATHQYYPLLHSAFWLQYQLWGDNTFAYHAVNLALHLGAVCLAYFILCRLKIPGALLAAAIFALHPVQVETVAWITEQKNTLSVVFYLGSLLAYLHFDENRGKGWYALALVLFALGLLSKTVTATLPAAMLVVFWWQRGRLSLKRDVLPLVPFFLVGAGFGVLTAWVEWTFIGARGEEFELSLVERCLVAGRVIWFYLFKLLWPANLVFIYPRWQLDAAAAWQWLFPLAAIAMTVFLWAIRGVTRAPLAAWLLFVGTLFPVLGFLNVYPFIFSFVADHFQYLASLSVIALVAGGIVTGMSRLGPGARWAARAACVGVLGILAVLTWRQIPMYADSQTLYRETIARNPQCWMAYNNLGGELFRTGKKDLIEEARDCFQKALDFKPGYPEALNNLGAAMLNLGRPQEAADYASQAVRIRPRYADAHCNLGNALSKLGRTQDALSHLQIAVQLDPREADANNSLGAVLLESGHPDEALKHFEVAIASKPNAAEIHNNLGVLFLSKGQVQQAIEHLTRAVEIRPDYPEAFCNLADVMRKVSNNPKAVEFYLQAIKLDPNYAVAHARLGVALYNSGQIAEGVEHLAAAVRLSPDNSEARNNLGALLIKQGRSQEALEHLEACVRLDTNSSDGQFNLGNALFNVTRYQEAAERYLQTVRLKPDFAEGWAGLARAYARLNRSADAEAAARQALELAHRQGQTELAKEVESWFTPVPGGSQAQPPEAIAPAGASAPPPPVLPPP
jgi:tetratricopeptide (TPR) repeat protein